MKKSYIANIDSQLKGDVGNKFKNIAKVFHHGNFNIPDSLCLRGIAFAESLPENSKKNIEILIKRLSSNGGYRLNKIQQEIQDELGSLYISKYLQNQLLEAADQVSNSWSRPLIFRTSSTMEDGLSSSGAGIYTSVARVYEPPQVVNAVVTCWHSFFSLSALAHRLRIKSFNITDFPGVIIQEYIDEIEYSGVTFSRDPSGRTNGVYIEYVSDTSYGVESGVGDSNHLVAIPISNSEFNYTFSQHKLPIELVNGLLQSVHRLQRLFSNETEFEWVYKNGKLFILQVRPITTAISLHAPNHSRESVVEIFDLYKDYDLLAEKDLGDISEIFQHSITKRMPIRDFAEQSNVKIYGASVLTLNYSGAEKLNIETITPLSRLHTELLTIDLGPYLRSFYSSRERFRDTILSLLRGNTEISSIIVREFASGEFSAISSVTKSGALVEVCRGSLIGLNRGFVATQTIDVNLVTGRQTILSNNEVSDYYDFDVENQCFLLTPAGTKPSPYTISDKTLYEIAVFTVQVADKFGNNILEWTILKGTPVYIDNQPVLDNMQLPSKMEEESNNVNFNRFLSKGEIYGTILCINALDSLEYISSGPTLNVSGHLPTFESDSAIRELLKVLDGKDDTIIVSKYPYAALSVFIDKVNGFIFESGPMLCHLAIICREANVPIVIVEGALSKYKTGDLIVR